MTNTIRVAAIQLIAGPDVETNLAHAGGLIAEAAEQGAQLVLLPEYFALIHIDERAKLGIREPFGHGTLQQFLSTHAARHRIWLIGGTVPLEASDDSHVRNSTLVYDPEGRCVARYDKIHLFSFQRGEESYDESRVIEPGGEIVCFDGPCGRVGLSVCYDLRFPELFRRMGPVDLIVLPAAFTETTGRAHWEVLLRARAIENQCYVLACGQGGEHPSGRRTWGHSMLIDPWGEVVGRLGTGPGLVLGEIDPARIAAVRESLPALQHRILT
ncbi:MAG: acyltransferase [Candidatus Dactylopiibacterium carminicum]|uniref:Acyltransferase n=1 Tax=Candidatus Dactylopiibacterium carminicum TaxID=857335 RepID=A0A272ETM5_9RHOO|nr:carbon-nitrogen hydrolase family protein [Candidatus Dactylopiibacterium carminicum]KAF7599391.1 carbon-nitrogen hydrolase family protein [Candidatus Dactylopiibacterium carminicum]PAS93451.1 MAG: acyltransferase [Candidatus Dactylopiibacterium carminicum]PAS95970.1 MAG: acyltransferase [Candidatus Dactylopiibacterium carminicum]PAS99400.1 MAG: acyltransferase [Candidatus Dactylopiibacterium carminicum]